MMAGFMLRFRALATLHPDDAFSSAMSPLMYGLGAATETGERIGLR